MRRAAIPLVAWGALLALWTLVQLIFSPDAITVALLGGASLAVFLTAAVVALAAAGPEERPIPDVSVATVTAAVGVSIAVIGAQFGTWCILLGLGLAAFGLGGVVRERRAERRSVR